MITLSKNRLISKTNEKSYIYIFWESIFKEIYLHHSMSHQKGYDRYLKVILSGLDNAGKSSMLVVMKKMYEYEEAIESLRPTMRIDHYRRSFLNYNLDINDMGGQEKFRESYIDREIYFEEADAFIYLIDIKDAERIPISLEYMSSVLEILKKTGFNRDKIVHVCFTKTDVDKKFAEIKEFEENRMATQKKIVAEFPEFKFNFYYTSIYNVYSIVEVFSNALTACIDGFGSIYNEIDEFAQQYEFENVVLYDHKGLIMSEYKKIPSKFAVTDEHHEISMDNLISSNLDYFKKVEDEDNENFRFFQHVADDCINYGYRFSVPGTPETFYVSVIVSKENEKKYDWSTHELIERLSDMLRAICCEN